MNTERANYKKEEKGNTKRREKALLFEFLYEFPMAWSEQIVKLGIGAKGFLESHRERLEIVESFFEEETPI